MAQALKIDYLELVKSNIMAMRGRLSIRLEPEIWDGLTEICHRENVNFVKLLIQVDINQTTGGRTSALRIYVFNYLRTAATEGDHRDASHGLLSTIASLTDHKRGKEAN